MIDDAGMKLTCSFNYCFPTRQGQVKALVCDDQNFNHIVTYNKGDTAVKVTDSIGSYLFQPKVSEQIETK